MRDTETETREKREAGSEKKADGKRRMNRRLCRKRSGRRKNKAEDGDTNKKEEGEGQIGRQREAREETRIMMAKIKTTIEVGPEPRPREGGGMGKEKKMKKHKKSPTARRIEKEEWRV